MVFPLPRHDDTEAGALLANFLALEGRVSLHSELVDHLGLAEWVEVSRKQADLAAELHIDVQAREGVDLERLERAVDAYVAKVPVLIAGRTLAMLKANMMLNALLSLEDVLDRANRHLAALRASRRPFSLREYRARIQRVSVEHLRRVARSYLNPKRRLAAHHRATAQSRCAAGCVSYEIEPDS
jgi:predicted Zn-dependent peptidase